MSIRSKILLHRVGAFTMLIGVMFLGAQIENEAARNIFGAMWLLIGGFIVVAWNAQVSNIKCPSCSKPANIGANTVGHATIPDQCKYCGYYFD